MTTMLMNDASSRGIRSSVWPKRGFFRVRDVRHSDRTAQRWNEVDARLAQWQRSCSGMVEEGIEPPSTRLIAALRAAIRTWSAASPPDAVVPSGDGGVAFEWRSGGRTVDIEFSSHGEATLRFFDGMHFQVHRRFSIQLE